MFKIYFLNYFTSRYLDRCSGFNKSRYFYMISRYQTGHIVSFDLFETDMPSVFIVKLKACFFLNK